MKETQRKYCVTKRNELSKEERTIKNKEISELLISLLRNLNLTISTLTIAMYMPIRSEVDITSLFNEFKAVAIPKVMNDTNMTFYSIPSISDVEIGNFNVLEPISEHLMRPNEIDVIIVPMVGYDTNKQRIGYGKGYYDRYLNTTNVICIGVAYECQKVEHICINEYDKAMNYIVTEQGSI